jgi:hypothetical protein
MCFPAVAAVAGLAGSLVSGMGSIMAGNQQAAASRAQGKADRVGAQNTFYQGEFEAGKVRNEADKLTGRQVAGVGESGFALSGSPLDVIGSSASDAALDIGAIKWSARSSAENLQYKAKLEDINAKSQQTGGYLNAAAGVLGSISKFTSLGQPYGAR